MPPDGFRRLSGYDATSSRGCIPVVSTGSDTGTSREAPAHQRNSHSGHCRCRGAACVIYQVYAGRQRFPDAPHHRDAGVRSGCSSRQTASLTGGLVAVAPPLRERVLESSTVIPPMTSHERTPISTRRGSSQGDRLAARNRRPPTGESRFFVALCCGARYDELNFGPHVAGHLHAQPTCT